MTHYSSYDSFKTKKSLEKKQKSKNKLLNNKFTDFIIDRSEDYGIVIEVKYNDAYVLYNDELVLARLKKGLNFICNKIIFPGDKVKIIKEKEYIITNLIKRTSILSRLKKDSTKRNAIGLVKYIAANIDLAVIVVSSKEPPLHPKFIDRYLLILENSNIPYIICLNKCDLKTENEEKILTLYKNLGITVIETSTYNNIGIDELKKYLLNKQTIFIGNSGVGKSSLTNSIMNNDEIKTNNISNKSKRGKHTTTSCKYYIWNDNSSIIDTPGIRSLDVSSFSVNEIQDYFKEFNNFKNKCKYKDCIHYHEPYNSCIIKQNVNKGLININRYESYLRIVENILEEDNSKKIINDLKNKID